MYKLLQIADWLYGRLDDDMRLRVNSFQPFVETGTAFGDDTLVSVLKVLWLQFEC